MQRLVYVPKVVQETAIAELATVIPTAWYFLMTVARQCALPLYNRNRRMTETYVDVLENKNTQKDLLLTS